MNSAVDKMTPFMVMEVLEQAQAMQAQGIDVIHLEVGEPDFDLHPAITAAAKHAYDAAQTHYTHSLGDGALREAIATFYHHEYGVTVDPACVLVTSGSSPAILLALQALCDVGDEVICSNPGYPCYRNFALACHANPIGVPVAASNGFQFDLATVRAAITPRTRGIFVNSPMNPAGTCVAEETFRDLATLGVPILSDEIYHGLVYHGRPHTVLEYTDNAFVFNGFSKRFAMTGLRLGYLIAPKRYMRALQILQQNLFICAPSTAQCAGIAALRLMTGNDAAAKTFQADQAKMLATYDARRVYMIKRLRDLGFGIDVEPQGAFYIFADARRFTTNTYRFAFDTLARAHVGITPGTDFGTNGEGFVRFSYANSMERIEEALNRLAE